MKNKLSSTGGCVDVFLEGLKSLFGKAHAALANRLSIKRIMDLESIK